LYVELCFTRAMNRLVLASQSPRRSELLSRAGFQFTVSSIQISEIPDENLNLDAQIQDLARQKAEACLNSGKVLKGQGNLVLSADTVVILDDQILGKPLDRRENRQLLERLSGRRHRVITAVCLVEVDTGKRAVSHETSWITFRVLSEAEIDEYVSIGDGLDKAGGYGIQGEAGRFVENLEGPMDNVIGLPVALVEKLIKENGWNVDRG
jgi:septum formation protein